MDFTVVTVVVGLTTSSFYSILLRKTLPFGPNSRKNRNKMLPQVVVGLQIHDAVVSWRVVVLEKKCLESAGRQMTQTEGLTSTASVSCKTGGTAVGVGCFFSVHTMEMPSTNNEATH